VSERMAMSRVWAIPNADTFDVEPIHNFVWKYLNKSKVSIDPFARNKRWATHTNDLNPETAADFHMEALEFIEALCARGIKADLAIWDPPYSLEQCSRSYQQVGRKVTECDTQIFGRWTEHRHALNSILSNDAVVLTFGWNSQGMGKKHGFELEELMLVWAITNLTHKLRQSTLDARLDSELCVIGATTYSGRKPCLASTARYSQLGPSLIHGTLRSQNLWLRVGQ
jgi:hypothetical protein